jgi:hypothetical protein
MKQTEYQEAEMRKITSKLSVLIGSLIIFISMAGCSSGITENSTPAETSQPTAKLTNLARLLSLVPYAFLEKNDVWFGDQKAAKELNGISDVNSQEAFLQLSSDQRKQVLTALQGIAGVFTINNWQKIAPLTGYDVWSVDRSIFVNMPPPWAYYISEGQFDKEVITGKLMGLGYQKVAYGSYSYYKINDDFSTGIPLNPVSAQVLAAMNRIAILDSTVIIAPATDIMTELLDTLAGKATAAIDNPGCRALAASLGDLLSGVIMNPERTLNLNPPQKMPLFEFTVPSDWGVLHQYELTGIGFKNDGKDRYWVISLYYKDAQDATEDADILANRLKNYIFNTHLNQTPGQTLKPVPLTLYPGTVNPSATLTIECRYKRETGGGYWQFPVTESRDLLFLAPDPTPYLKQ